MPMISARLMSPIGDTFVGIIVVKTCPNRPHLNVGHLGRDFGGREGEMLTESAGAS